MVDGVTRVRADDVLVDGAVLVRVGDPMARVVPVLARWESDVLELAATADDEFLVGGYSTSRNRASALTASLMVPPGHPKLSCARLRSTWLLWHLMAGTRLPELAGAAGLQGVTVLSDLLGRCPTDGRAGCRFRCCAENASDPCATRSGWGSSDQRS